MGFWIGYIGPLNKPILVVVLAFGIPIAIWECAESVHVISARNYPMTDGTVVSRSKFSKYGVPRYELSISIDDSRTEVVAITNASFAESCPDRVHFRFSGDPAAEVFLEGEENPVYAAVILVAACILLPILYFTLRGRKGWNRFIE